MRRRPVQLTHASVTRVDREESLALDLVWLAEWLRRLKQDHGMTTAELAKICHVRSQMLSQLKDPEKYQVAPGVELFWRLMAVYHNEPEWADLPDDAIRATLLRVVAAIGPSRIHYLASISSSEAQALVDDDQRKREARRRLGDSRGADEKS